MKTFLFIEFSHNTIEKAIMIRTYNGSTIRIFNTVWETSGRINIHENNRLQSDIENINNESLRIQIE